MEKQTSNIRSKFQVSFAKLSYKEHSQIDKKYYPLLIQSQGWVVKNIYSGLVEETNHIKDKKARRAKYKQSKFCGLNESSKFSES